MLTVVFRKHSWERQTIFTRSLARNVADPRRIVATVWDTIIAGKDRYDGTRLVYDYPQRSSCVGSLVVVAVWDRPYSHLEGNHLRTNNISSSRMYFNHYTKCTIHSSSSSLCAICSQQVGCHGSPSFSILCHSDTVIIWHFCPFLDVIRPHCSRSPSSSSTIYPSFHQQSLYPISSYYMSKILTFPFLIVFNNDLLVFILCKTSALVFVFFPWYS